jgi:hypothetical protein
MLTLLAVVGVTVATSLGVASTASAADAFRTVTGTWGLHTNDCGAGSGISGMVSGSHIAVNFTGVSFEDDWSCVGTLNLARTRFHGTFQDGTGGSGLCNAWRIVS